MDADPTGGQDCTITFVGTATVLLRLGEFALLSDPNFVRRGQWVHIGHGLLTRRRTEPAMTIDELPPLDGLVLSHLHGDHFDRVAARELPRDLPIFTTHHAARRLGRTGFTEPVPLPRWGRETMTKGGARLTITSLPGKHARGVLSAVVPPVMGTLVDYEPPVGRGLRLYLTGDTLVHDDLAAIGERFPGIDVALVHLGGTRVLGQLLTMDGPEGADLLELLRPSKAVPIHYDDYGLFKSPLSEFEREVRRRGIAGVEHVVRGDSLALFAPGEEPGPTADPARVTVRRRAPLGGR
ncbi:MULTISPECIES: MBL fold metallo-hydrolase [Saccharopolyspora]|uniref:MBL fold metallo-hydrolase n=1 Tax=Saccharopolyspora gregorii TaxID=33914 RepID=A0ABP6RV81_9PSEU|nr:MULTISPECIES: MBL fold metallo-hydrolase [Saccharopolyspora]MCA1192152.1 MBL fold metallo-hydrolase [Saccharopolyspora sp. 6V]MCA1225825.1 MBL fold metallo-hydrolase [Saccharopolyspora sp. 6M]